MSSSQPVIWVGHDPEEVRVVDEGRWALCHTSAIVPEVIAGLEWKSQNACEVLAGALHIATWVLLCTLWCLDPTTKLKCKHFFIFLLFFLFFLIFFL